MSASKLRFDPEAFVRGASIVRLALRGTQTGPLALPFGRSLRLATGWTPRVRTYSNCLTERSGGSTVIAKGR